MNQNNLSMNTVKEENAQLYQTKRIELNEDTFLEIDITFSPSKIEDVVEEVISSLKDVSLNRGIKPFTSKNLMAAMTGSIIKHFSSIETDANDFDGLCLMSADLKNRNYFEPIVSAFDDKEMNKVWMEIKLAIFAINTQLKYFNKEEKELFIKAIEENEEEI